jgi:hypothetical protein
VIGVSSASASRGSAKPFKVTSSIDGKQVLPLRIRWIAIPHISPSKVAKVDFLVDGRWLWTEHQTPYVYGGDNDKGYGNWLVTSFLKPGLHTFTVRAAAIGGPTETDTVRARVIQAPSPPSHLAGTWTHHISGPCGACNKNGDITTSITILGWGTPPGDYWDARYLPGGKIVFGPEEALPHMSAGARLGGFCNSIDPLYTWTYTVAADDQSFQLHPIGKDPCPDRQHGLEGTWTRVK